MHEALKTISLSSKNRNESNSQKLRKTLFYIMFLKISFALNARRNYGLAPC